MRPPRAAWLLVVLLVVVSGVVILVLRAGTIPPAHPSIRQGVTPEQVVRRFADAITQRDYATARALVMQGSAWAGDYLVERTEEQHRMRILDHYVLTRLTLTGQSTTAVVHWSPIPGATIGGVPARDVCLTVQIGPDGQIQPIDDYHWCKDGE